MASILVTGGAGFIGSHTIDALLERGHRVRVLDSLDPQVHGRASGPPDYLSKKVEFQRGDVLDRDALERALDGVDHVLHLAAKVGVGQSMYQIDAYTEANCVGTARVLEAVVKRRDRIRKLVVASSMSIYGEGRYRCKTCGDVAPKLRPRAQLEARRWELDCPNGHGPVEPAPTDESKPLLPTSVYAVTKRDQEELCLSVGWSYRIPTVALRYFNVYGPRQALSNPYTGVAAIFSGRLLNAQPPVVYEDGLQTRDFVHVSDIAQANVLALETSGADYEAVNVGTGRCFSVLELANLLIAKLQPGKKIAPAVEQKFREGDIRHCVADTSRATKLLGFRAKVAFETGIDDLLRWVRTQTAADAFDAAKKELDRRGLTL
jgi:dTDP-L-rhamnose 4-epimerase